jgi:hypothetical protein
MVRPSERRFSIRASSRAKSAALMVRRSGPDGIGTSSCQRIPLPPCPPPQHSHSTDLLSAYHPSDIPKLNTPKVILAATDLYCQE